MQPEKTPGEAEKQLIANHILRQIIDMLAYDSAVTHPIVWRHISRFFLDFDLCCVRQSIYVSDLIILIYFEILGINGVSRQGSTHQDAQ